MTTDDGTYDCPAGVGICRHGLVLTRRAPAGQHGRRGPAGSPLADMDRITQGIRSIDYGDTGGGVGSSIGPTG